MIPNASGKMPPPTPWMARATISSASELETPASRVPALQHDERPDEQALLAVHVAEPADDRGADGGREQVRGEDPGDPVLGGVQVVLDRRQRRHDSRAEHRERETGDREDSQGHVRMAALRVLHPRRLTTPPPATAPSGRLVT